MTDPTDQADEEDSLEEKKKKKKMKGDEGSEGDSDSWGRGKAGAASGRRIRLSPQQLKKVMAEWRQLNVEQAVEAVAEFFADMPMRASANLAVVWTQIKNNPKSFAIVNWVHAFGEKVRNDLTMEKDKEKGRGRDTKGFKVRKSPKATAPKAATPNLMNGPKPSGF